MRLTWHISHRLKCLEDLVPSSAVMEVLSPRLKIKDVLELEAVHTIVSYHQPGDHICRGGPYCLKKLTTADKEELHALLEICSKELV